MTTTQKNVQSIRQYMGWNASKMVEGNNVELTTAPKSLLNLFSVAAEFILVVPDTFFEDVIVFLKDKGYVYKTVKRTVDSVIAVQYAKV